MASDKSVVDKIIKLFALADSRRNNHQEEALLALAKAKELMQRHNISMGQVQNAIDINGGRKQPQVGILDNVRLRRRAAKFPRDERYVARAVAVVTGTRVYYRRELDRTLTLHFIGEQTDVAVACALLPILLKTMRAGARALLGPKWTAAHSSYHLGFAIRLMERADESVAPPASVTEQQTLAVVLRRKEEAIDRVWDTLGIRYGRPERAPSYRSESAYRAGREHGGRVSLSTRKTIEGR